MINAVIKLGYATRFRLKAIPRLVFRVTSVKLGSRTASTTNTVEIPVTEDNPQITVSGFVEGNIDNMPSSRNVSVMWHTVKKQIQNGNEVEVNNYHYTDAVMTIKAAGAAGTYQFEMKPQLQFMQLSGGLYGNSHIRFEIFSGFPYAEEIQADSKRRLLFCWNRIAVVNKPAVIKRGSTISFQWDHSYPLLKEIKAVNIYIYAWYMSGKYCHSTLIKTLQLKDASGMGPSAAAALEVQRWRVGDCASSCYGLGWYNFSFRFFYPYKVGSQDYEMPLDYEENFVKGLEKPKLYWYKLIQLVSPDILYYYTNSTGYEKYKVESFLHRNLMIEGKLTGYTQNCIKNI